MLEHYAYIDSVRKHIKLMIIGVDTKTAVST